MIRAQIMQSGSLDEVSPDSGDWVFVDLGFSATQKSCGVAEGEAEPELLRYADTLLLLRTRVDAGSRPINLVVEAPLSVAFDAEGNPTGRIFEKRAGSQSRYWYVGAGAALTVAAIRLLQFISQPAPGREIRLYEGFVSFKPKGKKSNHVGDVKALRSFVWGERVGESCLVPPGSFAVRPDHRLESIGQFFGVDFGVPPVIIVDPPGR